MTSTTAERACQMLTSPDADVLWHPLETDGFVVDVAHEGEQLHVSIREGEAPCDECLVPRDTIRQIVLMFLGDRDLDTASLAVSVHLPTDP